MRMMTRLTLVVALLASGGSIAHANDGVFGGTASDLVPLQERRVRMASEDIRIEYGPRGDGLGTGWNITATYQFENTSVEVLALTFGFPEAACPEESDGDCVDGYTFNGLRTTVRGEPVEHRIGTVDRGNAWAPELGRVHLFDVRIEPGESIEIVHRYAMGLSGSFMGDLSVVYVTRTGALWNGPIGSARFTIRTPFRPYGFSFPKEYRLVTFRETPHGSGRAGGTTEIVFEQKEWTPTADLDVVLDSSWSAPLAPCPSMPEVVGTVFGGERGDRMDVDAARTLFEGVPTEQLSRCRNWPYAVHGYEFRDEALRTFFYETRRDQPGLLDDHEGAAGRTVVRFRENPDYKSSLLTLTENRYVAVVLAVERSRRKK